jgi:hypothetical protein
LVVASINFITIATIYEQVDPQTKEYVHCYFGDGSKNRTGGQLLTKSNKFEQVDDEGNPDYSKMHAPLVRSKKTRVDLSTFLALTGTGLNFATSGGIMVVDDDHMCYIARFDPSKKNTTINGGSKESKKMNNVRAMAKNDYFEILDPTGESWGIGPFTTKVPCPVAFANSFFYYCCEMQQETLVVLMTRSKSNDRSKVWLRKMPDHLRRHCFSYLPVCHTNNAWQDTSMEYVQTGYGSMDRHLLHAYSQRNDRQFNKKNPYKKCQCIVGGIRNLRTAKSSVFFRPLVFVSLRGECVGNPVHIQQLLGRNSHVMNHVQELLPSGVTLNMVGEEEEDLSNVGGRSMVLQGGIRGKKVNFVPTHLMQIPNATGVCPDGEIRLVDGNAWFSCGFESCQGFEFQAKKTGKKNTCKKCSRSTKTNQIE